MMITTTSLEKLLVFRALSLYYFTSCIIFSTIDIIQAEGLIDPDTPPSAYITDSRVLGPDGKTPRGEYDAVGKQFKLVFSDEFNVPDRSFDDGHDPTWTTLHKNDYTNAALQYYHKDNARTSKDGNLEIITESKDTEIVGFNDATLKPFKFKKHFRSAMLQSWNKFCLTGGIIEAEVQFPGKHDVSGLWPALWLLGNFARHTFDGTSRHMWPWSTHECNQHTKNSQKINSCLNSVHYGLHSNIGRGAPEVDIFEIQAGEKGAGSPDFWNMPVGQPFMSASYQVAPGREGRPWTGHWPGPGQWYDGIKYGQKTCLNLKFYGHYNAYLTEMKDMKKHYWSDAISSNRQLDESHFTGMHKYRLEWGLPERAINNTGIGAGYLTWFIDNELIVQLNGTILAETGSLIPDEPMYMIINTALSTQWGFPDPDEVNQKCRHEYDCHGKYEATCGFPPSFCDMLEESPKYKINYLRVYQNEQNEREKVGCSTPERPTKKYIEANSKSYKMADDKEPLKPIQIGGGECDPASKEIGASSCGGIERGICKRRGVCKCKKGWIGPQCLAHDSLPPVKQSHFVTLMESIAPIKIPLSLFILMLFMGSFLSFAVAFRRRLDGWTPVKM